MNLPVYVALGMGYLEEMGMDYELIDVGSGAPIAQALASNSADVGSASFESQILARNEGAPLVSIAPTQDRLTLFVVVNGDVLDAAGISEDSTDEEKLQVLEGRHFGLSSFGGGSYTVTLQLLAMAGLTEEDVGMTATGDANATLALFQQGVSDTMVTASPYADLAVRDFGGEILFDFPAGDLPPISDVLYQTLMTGQRGIEGREAKLECFVGALDRAYRLMADDLDQSLTAARPFLEEVEPDEDTYRETASRYIPAAPDSVGFTDQVMAAAERTFEQAEGSADGGLDITLEDVLVTDIAERALTWARNDE